MNSNVSRFCQARPREPSVPLAPTIQRDGSRDKARVAWIAHRPWYWGAASSSRIRVLYFALCARKATVRVRLEEKKEVKGNRRQRN